MKKNITFAMILALLVSLFCFGCDDSSGGDDTTATYTVTYEANAPEGMTATGTVPADTNAYTSGQSVAVYDNTGYLDVPGFRFNGWNTAADGTGDPYTTGQRFVMAFEDVTLYAQWTTGVTYTMIYDANGATGGAEPVDSTNYLEGQTVYIQGNTGNLSIEGYVFTGWNSERDGSGIIFESGNSCTFGAANITLYAQWRILSYTVTYEPNGAESGAVPVDPVIYHYEQTVTVLPLASELLRTGYRFCGWNTAADGSGTCYTQGQAFTIADVETGSVDVRLYAQWTTGTTYTVDYDANTPTGSTATGTAPVDYTHYLQGHTVVVLGNTGDLAVNGYMFLEWNTAPDRSGATYADGQTFTMGHENSTLYAIWKMKTWEPVGSAGFSAGEATNTSLALDSHGTPYVAYGDEGNSGKSTVMKYTGSGATGWEPVGTAGFSAGEADGTSLALDSHGTPYVAYNDGGNSNKSTVMKYTGSGATGWEPVGSTGFSAGSAGHTSLVIKPNGTPYVGYGDGGNSSKATVMKYTGSGATGWEPVGSAGFSAGVAYDTSLVLDSTGTPYVAYRDAGNSYKATVMKYTGSGTTGWEPVGSAGFSAGRAWDTSLTFDSNGTPYVAYEDEGNSYKATVMRYTGSGTTGWEVVGSPGFSSNLASSISLALDSYGTPYVAYSDGGNSADATVMKYTGSGTTGWEAVGSPGFSAGWVLSPSLALDSNGTPYVAYQDFGNDGKATVMKFE